MYSSAFAGRTEAAGSIATSITVAMNNAINLFLPISVHLFKRVRYSPHRPGEINLTHLGVLHLVKLFLNCGPVGPGVLQVVHRAEP